MISHFALAASLAAIPPKAEYAYCLCGFAIRVVGRKANEAVRVRCQNCA